MSYNNYLDADAAYQTCCDYADPTCVIVKHTNPCGAATALVSDGLSPSEENGSAADLRAAYRRAVEADPISAFGGIVAFNRPVDAALAREIREFRSPTDGETRMFYEIVVAPGYTKEGLETLRGKSKALRILEAPLRSPSGRSARQVASGWLVQGHDDVTPSTDGFKWECKTKVQPTAEQLEDLAFAWRAAKHVKSNAIAVAKGGRLLGMGSGQPNRVESVRLALGKAGKEAEGSALASDAFFPFSRWEAVEFACQAGVKFISHPCGSLRDEECVAVCDEYGVCCVTTGYRHFRH